MRVKPALIWVALGAVSLALMGCGLDPMERLSQQVKSPDPAQRKEAVRDLANLDDVRAIKRLVDALESDPETADWAAVALVKKGRAFLTRPKENPVVKAVGEVLKSELVAPELRARAAWTLGEIGDRRAIPDLKAAAGAPEAIGLEATRGLEKLGYKPEGRPPDLAPALLAGPIETFPPVPPLAQPEPPKP